MIFRTALVFLLSLSSSQVNAKLSRRVRENGKSGSKGKGKGKGKDGFSLRILHVNDHHSHLEPESFDIDDITSAFPVSLQGLGEIEIKVGGWPMLTSAVATAAKEGEDMDSEVLKLHAGDAVTGTLYYTLFEGEADAAFMNSICFDAFALGNHEFDDGDSGLADFLDFLNAPAEEVSNGSNGKGKGKGKGKSSDEDSPCFTPVVAANVVPGPTSPLQGRLLKNVVFDYKDHMVGVVGIDVRQKTLVSSNPDEGTDLLDEETVVIEQVAALQEMGVDIIILLTHVGIGTDLSTMATIPGVDIVVGGDSHTFMGFTPPYPIEETTFDYPEIVTKADGTITCVVQAYQYGYLLGVLDASFDENGNVVSCSGNPVVPYDITTADAAGGLSDKQKMDLEKYLEGTYWKSTIPDEDSVAALATYTDEVDVLSNQVIAQIVDDICYERIPGQGRSNICDCSESETQGGGVCNVVAQAFVEVSATADFALQNAGGCRTDLPAGDFTIADAYTLLPFSNTLVTLEATGAEIITLLNQGLANSASSTGAYPYAYGLRYDVDLTTFTVSNVEVNPRLEGTWSSIDVGATYTVVTNSFLASGGDGYFLAETLPQVDLFTEYAQAFVDFATAVGTIMDLPLSEYSTKSVIAGARTCP